ncbi:ABC transporter permease [Echinicola strongylocentroti]|uniref:ABC transporter permease n=1 Tax=Echinicola strongylocentroti TaxID=1795355 RepID=A0A2Z4IHE6_9BACT|nr:ABC transporter permease [Echinicola strongylocentroti]AWW29843.1 ABC transporter permease [Echinicola strongylocentroti]
MIIFKLIWESFRFALQALRSNLTRTVLSLLGVTIGIFAIIAVFTLVDSLEKNIKSSFSFLGTNVLRVDRFPFSSGPGEYPWWRYFRRPPGNYSEFVFLKDRLQNAEAITISASSSATLKRGSSSFEGANLEGVVFDHKEVYDVPVVDGRFFTELEITAARNVTVLGAKIANALFPEGDAVGKEMKIKGQKFVVIGLLEEEGEGLFDLPSKDDACLIPFGSFGKMYYLGRWGVEPTIAAKGMDSDKGLIALENEMTGLLRGKRGLKPTEEDNFALNKSEFIQNAIGAIFDVISIAGAVIGGFSILVGGFGIANIMFVSVRERTNIIGIQKSLGAKNYFILLQFLFESTFLSLFGGLTGLLLVFAITFVPLGSLEIFMSAKNMILGIGLSMVIGMLSGVVPAGIAARMDPVEAIRTN